ncbi:MAG TPA: hypothetical protein VHC96_16310 [Puia sp.]|nr:hypothetical protein [Puia sp.]
MRSRLLYTLVFIFCLSAFASSKNDCAYPPGNSSPCMSAGKELPSKEISKEVSREVTEEGQDFSTFQLVKFLYI